MQEKATVEQRFARAIITITVHSREFREKKELCKNYVMKTSNENNLRGN